MTEILGAGFGIAGTLLLALKGRRAGWGFVAFLASNVAWISFAIAQGHRWLMLQHTVFMATSLLGIYTWLLRGRVRLFIGHYRIARQYSTRWQAIGNAWLFARLLP